jgi:GT2 family glycosyltransferase
MIAPVSFPRVSPRFSIVVLTYFRDAILAEVLERLWQHIGTRTDTELILVDNNPPSAERAELLTRFADARLIGEGFNKGVVARNDGFAAARGEIVVLLDDDVLVETPDFLDRFAARFDADARLGAVTIAKHVRGDNRRRVDLIPHTDKSVDLTHPFETFRFVGGCVGFRAKALAEVGGFLPDFFYGLEEIELSYRIIDGSWKILYSPDIAAEELEHPAGRRPKREVQTDRLANKYIISYLRMPFPWIVINYILFTPYLMFFARGDVSVTGALKQFARWLARADRPRRKPISPATISYIRQCGGSVWR